MIKLLVSVISSILFSTVWISSIHAESQPSCLEKAAQKIKPNSEITLVKTDQSKISGRLLSIDLERLSLSLIQTGDTTAGSHSIYEISDIAKIQYRARGKMKPGVILPFTILGAVVGGAIGVIESGGFCVDINFGGNGGNNCYRNVGRYAGIGALGGLVIGTVESLSTKGTFTIKCR